MRAPAISGDDGEDHVPLRRSETRDGKELEKIAATTELPDHTGERQAASRTARSKAEGRWERCISTTRPAGSPSTTIRRKRNWSYTIQGREFRLDAETAANPAAGAEQETPRCRPRRRRSHPDRKKRAISVAQAFVPGDAGSHTVQLWSPFRGGKSRSSRSPVNGAATRRRFCKHNNPGVNAWARERICSGIDQSPGMNAWETKALTASNNAI